MGITLRGESRPSGNKTPRCRRCRIGHWETAATHLHQPAEGAGAIEQRLQDHLIDDSKGFPPTDRQPGQIVPGPLQLRNSKEPFTSKAVTRVPTDLIHHHKETAQGGGDGVTQPKKNGSSASTCFCRFAVVSSIAMTTAMAARQASSRHGPRQRNQRRSRSKAGTGPARIARFTRHKRWLRDPRGLEQRSGSRSKRRRMRVFSITKQWKQQRFQPIPAEVAFWAAALSFHAVVIPLLLGSTAVAPIRFFLRGVSSSRRLLSAPWTLSKKPQVLAAK